MPDNTQRDSAQSSGAKENSAQKDLSTTAKNNSCAICRANGIPPPCKGHGRTGGGGGDSGEKADKSGGQTPANTSGRVIDTVGQVANVATDGSRDLNQQLQLNEEIFNPEGISELLSKKLLIVDNNRDSGILTIKLQCSPNLLSEEQRNELKKFVDTILNELDKFKKENGISANCAAINKDKEGNFLSLRITLPTPTIYDAFIQRLANKNLLPTQNIEQKEKVEYQEGMNHFNPTPLSMKPIPGTNKNTKLTDEEKHQAERHSTSKKEDKLSSIRPRSPLDGLKPKGWK